MGDRNSKWERGDNRLLSRTAVFARLVQSGESRFPQGGFEKGSCAFRLGPFFVEVGFNRPLRLDA